MARGRDGGLVINSAIVGASPAQRTWQVHLLLTLPTNLEEERRGGCSLGSSLAKGTKLNAPSHGRGLGTPFPMGDAAAVMGTGVQGSYPARLHSPMVGSGHHKGQNSILGVRPLFGSSLGTELAGGCRARG